jgi:hypothetical protein
MTLYEVDEAANRIREEVDPEANIIFGSTFNEKMNGRMRVSVVATGIDAAAVKQKKQAYEEMAAVSKPQPDPSDQSASAAAENAASGDEKSQAFGVLKNNPADVGIRKRSPSLFERLTGMKKSFSSDRKDDFSAQQTKVRGNSEDEDLEIPAFLRKSS